MYRMCTEAPSEALPARPSQQRKEPQIGRSPRNSILSGVEVIGFEPTTSSLRSERSPFMITLQLHLNQPVRGDAGVVDAGCVRVAVGDLEPAAHTEGRTDG